MSDVFVHESAYVDDGAVIGQGSKIWHFCHVMPGAVIGERCNLGQNVVVSARPIAYRWNFGDGTSATTTTPGAPYPDLDVAHVYERTEEVTVSVDTQYGDASFTVDGGPPEAIPSTIWVAGAAQDLEVVEAIPQLVLQ